MAEDMGERTELPTSRRLQQARERGQVPKSPDLSAAVDLIGGLLMIIVLGGMIMKIMHGVMRRVLDNLATGVTLDGAKEALILSSIETVRILGPFLGVIFLVALVAQIMQVGWHPTTQPLEPKWSRLNFVAGIGNLFGKRNLVKTIVNSVKLVVILAVGGSFIWNSLREIAALPLLAGVPAMHTIGVLAVKLALWLLAIMLVIGLIDWLYQRWQHTQDLKMTRSDVKDERRSMEGDPQIKSYRFRMAQKIAMQRVNSAVPKADVIVTNPTHYSVAIQYDEGKMRAPRVVAKGADLMAFRIRQVAIAHGVPIVERPPLARAIYAAVPVGGEVQPKFYQAVAEILAYVYRLKKEKAA